MNKMPVSIVVDNPRSWFQPFARLLCEKLAPHAHTTLRADAADIPDGNEIAFILSYEKKVPAPLLARSRHNIVVHASALPQGKGMSPLTWQILEGKNRIPLTLFEATEAIDAGPIYLQTHVDFAGHELLPEMQHTLGEALLSLCIHFVENYPAVTSNGREQSGETTRYRRRIPEDSRLDPHQTIAAQFNLLRVADNDRYPAFFEWQGRKFLVKISSTSESAVL